MYLKLYEIRLKVKKKLVNFWYWLMKPIAYFFTAEKEDMRYKKKRGKITEEQAVKWIAEDITRYVIKYPRHPIHILICDYANEDHFWNGCMIDYHYIKRNKTRMAFGKFNNTVEFQGKVMDEVKKVKLLDVKEKIESFTSWKSIDNYQKTYIIKKK